tara:strand:+ start:5017 stop:5283 length:267 start_codon:yes stop_codon:yes gene_type:complete
MSYVCDPKKNFVDGKAYTQTHLGNGIPQHDAIQKCEKVAQGNDFFVQQHPGPVGYTICAVLKEPLSANDKISAHGHTYGSVCYKPPTQ